MKNFRLNIRLGALIAHLNDEFAHEAKNAEIRVRTDCRWFSGLNDMHIVPTAHM